MLSRIASLLSIVTLVAVATAAPNALGTRNGPVCSSGVEYCCDQKLSAPATVTGSLGGTLVGGVNAVPGLSCDPVTVAGGACSVQTVCCDGNQINGVTNVVCTPVAANI